MKGRRGSSPVKSNSVTSGGEAKIIKDMNDLAPVAAAAQKLRKTGNRQANIQSIIELLEVKDGCDFRDSVEKAYKKKERELNDKYPDIAKAGGYLEILKQLKYALQSSDVVNDKDLYEEGQDAYKTNSGITNSWKKVKNCSKTFRTTTTALEESTVPTKEPIPPAKQVISNKSIQNDIFEELYFSETAYPSKFIKCYVFFNNKTPTPFVRATISYPMQFIAYNEEAPGHTDTNQHIIEQDIDIPPYNKITSFNYDVTGRKVELEIKDSGDAMGEFFLTQLGNIQDYNGQIIVTVRYGWSSPYITRQNSRLIEDPDNYVAVKPRKYRVPGTKKTEELTSRARTYNVVSFALMDMEISRESTSTVYKLTGNDNDFMAVSPIMKRWMPINNINLANLPLGKLAIAFHLKELIKELREKIFFFIQAPKITESTTAEEVNLNFSEVVPQPKKLPASEKQLYLDKLQATINQNKTNIFEAKQLALELLSITDKLASLKSEDIEQLDKLNTLDIETAKKFGRTINVNPPTKNDDVINQLKYEEQLSLTYGLNLIKYLTNSIENSDPQVLKKQIERQKQLLTFLLTMSKNIKIPIAQAWKYVVDEARKHIAQINAVISSEGTRNKAEFIFLNFVNFNKANTEDPDNPAKYIEGIPVNSIVADISTTYKRLFENLAGLTKIKTKTLSTNKNDFAYLDTNVGWYHAKSKIEIENLVYAMSLRMQESATNLKEKNEKFDEYLKFMFKQFESQIKLILKSDNSFDIEKPDSIKGILRDQIQLQYDQIILMVLSEYSMDGFTDTVDSDTAEAFDITHGYCFRPQGFKTQANDYTITENAEISRSRTQFSTEIDTSYYNSGTLNIYHNNIPDVISFTPNINYGLIMSAMATLNKKDPTEAFTTILNQKQTLTEVKKELQEEKKRISGLTKEQREAEIKNKIDVMKSSIPVIDSELLNSFMGETDMEKFPMSLNVIPHSDNARAMLNNKMHRTIFKNRLMSFVNSYEADMSILGEPYYDLSSINKYIYIKVNNVFGQETYQSGIYQITNIIHEKQGGSFKTNFKKDEKEKDINNLLCLNSTILC